MSTPQPLRILRSTSASLGKGMGLVSALEKTIEDSLPTLSGVMEAQSSQGSDSPESTTKTSETSFTLDRDDVHSVLSEIMAKEHLPLTEKLSHVSFEVYIAKILHVILALVLLGKVISELLTNNKI